MAAQAYKSTRDSECTFLNASLLKQRVELQVNSNLPLLRDSDTRVESPQQRLAPGKKLPL
jgi:hypothetical protein